MRVTVSERECAHAYVCMTVCVCEVLCAAIDMLRLNC